MDMSKISRTYRLSPEVVSLLEDLTKHLNEHTLGKLSQADVVSLALKELAKDYIKMDSKE